MILLRSFWIGAAALVAYALVLAVVLWFRMPQDGLGAVAIPIMPAVLGALVVFASAFCWSFRRRS